MKEQTKKDFSIRKVVDDSLELYTDSIDVNNRVNQSSSYESQTWFNQEDVLKALDNSDTSIASVLKKSRKLYATNAIYAKIINYLATMWQVHYYFIPRYSPISGQKKAIGKDWNDIYNEGLEYVDGLNLEVKIPLMLKNLLIDGGVFFTVYLEEGTHTLDTIILPRDYSKRIGETEFGTDVIEFNFQYFDTLGLSKEELEDLLNSFPPEFTSLYKQYKAGKNKSQGWYILNPAFSSSVLLNSKAIPTMLYSYGNILNYETYSKNELSKNTQSLQFIVEHHIPTYQDKLLLETSEMNLLHKKLSKLVHSVPNARLVTTIGNIAVHPMLDTTSTVADDTLEKTYKSTFDGAALNNGIFYGDNQYSIAASLSVDKGIVWTLIEKIINFYNVVINNCGIDLKGYQISINLIPISRDSADQDIATLRESAKVGVGILPFLIASGIKQKDVDSYLDTEAALQLTSRLTPLRSSNTMSGTDETEESDTTDNSQTIVNEE